MPLKKDDTAYTDFKANEVAWELRTLYTRAASLLTLHTEYIRYRLISLAAEIHGSLTGGRLLFIDSKDKDLEFLQRMLEIAIAGDKNLIEYFVTTTDFHLIVYDEWLRPCCLLVDKYVAEDLAYTKHPNPESLRKIVACKEYFYASDGFRGVLLQIKSIYQQINNIRERIIHDYEALTLSCADLFSNKVPKHEYDSIKQAARSGTLKALLTFNPYRNIRFGVYARSWIMQSIIDHIKKHPRTAIRLPPGTWNDYAKISNAEASVAAKYGSLPHDDLTIKVAEVVKMSITRINAVKERVTAAYAVSLETTFSDDDDEHSSKVEDFISSSEEENQDLSISDTNAPDLLSENTDDANLDKTIDLRVLSKLQRNVVVLKFGLWHQLDESSADAKLHKEKFRQELANLLIKQGVCE